MNINPIARFALSLLAPDSPWPLPSLSGFRRNEILGVCSTAWYLLPPIIGSGFAQLLFPAFVGTRFSGTEESHRALYPDHWARACPVVGLDGLEPSTSVTTLALFLILARVLRAAANTRCLISAAGRSGWTRTIDLALIRRAL